MIFEEVCSRLKARKTPSGWWKARCPAHDDRNPSLSVREGKDGRVVLKCHAGCRDEEIVAAGGLGGEELGPRARPSKVARRQHGRRRTTFPTLAAAEQAIARSGAIVGRWDYVGNAGAVVMRVVRFETLTGKCFRPLARDSSDRWYIGDAEGWLPLYRLPELPAAALVFVTEGEGCVEAVRRIELTATTSAHGAQSAHKSDWRPLAGKDVVMLPDNDSAGEKYASHVAGLLTALDPPPRVRILRLPGLGPGGDIVDWIRMREARGDDRDAIRVELLTLSEQAEDVEIAMELPEQLPTFACVARPFPMDALPEPLRAFVSAGARAIGCDPAFLALPVLSVVASAIGDAAWLQIKEGWREPSSIWTAVVADSGTGKSPAQKIALEPIRELENEANEKYKRLLAEHESAVARYDSDLRRKSQVADPLTKPVPPRRERRLVGDVTIEALVDVLEENPRGLLVGRDELAGLLGSFGRYSGAPHADAASWLQLWSAAPLIVDRKTGKRSAFLSRPVASVTGGVQPGVLARVLGQEGFENGMAARFLLALPPRIPKRWTDDEIDPNVARDYANTVRRLAELPIAEGGDPVVLRMDDGAKSAWVAFFDRHAERQKAASGARAAALSKLEAYAARLALVFALVRHVNGQCAWLVDRTSMELAIRLTEWFADELDRIYGVLLASEGRRRLTEMVATIRGLGESVSVRDWQRRRGYQSASDAEASLRDLVDARLARWLPPRRGKPGRTTKVLELLTERADTPTEPDKTPADGLCPVLSECREEEEEEEETWTF